MIQNVDKVTLQVAGSYTGAGVTTKKTKTYDILNESGSYSFENDAYSADAVAAYELAVAINALQNQTFLSAKVVGTEEVGENN